MHIFGFLTSAKCVAIEKLGFVHIKRVKNRKRAQNFENCRKMLKINFLDMFWFWFLDHEKVRKRKKNVVKTPVKVLK